MSMLFIHIARTINVTFMLQEYKHPLKMHNEFPDAPKTKQETFILSFK